MKIISHRGYWKDAPERNTLAAFDRSFGLGYGSETDVRDHAGQLVIAHDLPVSDTLAADECFAALARHDRSLLLAINVKADGLQHLLREKLQRYRIENYFLFDMSVPDAVQSIKAGLRVFTRQSDVEQLPSFYEHAAGVWMDSFFDDSWLTPTIIATHLRTGRGVCLVSPELHQREHLAFWQRLRNNQIAKDERLVLCTDLPSEAKEFFQT